MYAAPVNVSALGLGLRSLFLLCQGLCEIYLAFKLNGIGWLTAVTLVITYWRMLDLFLRQVI
jgi:hypothetical protein